MRVDGEGRLHGGDVLRGVAAGLVGGLVASWVMNEFQSVWSALSEESGEGGDEGSDEEAGDGASGERSGEDGGGGEESEEPATVKAAEAISENVFGHELTKSEKKIAGPLMHYGFGSTVGALYGGVVEAWPGATVGAGTLFGSAVWLGVDEAAVPALGLSDPPTEHPPSTHIYALVSHIVYGATTEAVRALLRSTILR